jgi:hypothetical protein
VNSTNTNLFPETLEDIVVWTLEHGQVERYLHHLHHNHKQLGRFPLLKTRLRVLDWIVRIRKLDGIVQFEWQRTGSIVSSSREFDSGYYLVRVASIQICTITPTEHNEIRGVTDV